MLQMKVSAVLAQELSNAKKENVKRKIGGAAKALSALRTV
jgi:hypothetical protein